MMRIFVIAVILVFSGNCIAQNTQESDDSSRKEAERIWELMIAAKGGRERLLNVRNMVVSERKTYRTLFKKTEYESRLLSVYPGVYWRWEDFRPSVLGVTVRMYNWQIHKKYVRDARDREIQLFPLEQVDYDQSADSSGNLKLGRSPFFLPETQWWKPRPVSVRLGKVGKEKVFIVRVVIEDSSADLFISQKTYLPLRGTSYTPKGEVSSEMKDYRAFDGIQMPTKLKLLDPAGMGWVTRTYQFNIEYNERVFTSAPPPFNTLDEAWKWITEGPVN